MEYAMQPLSGKRKHMRAPNGNHLRRMTMEEYGLWQGWDEWPERKADPPLTVETPFWYLGREYMITTLRGRYVIVFQPDFNEVISSDNFRELLEMPFINGKSFHDLLGSLLFED